MFPMAELKKVFVEQPWRRDVHSGFPHRAAFAKKMLLALIELPSKPN
jgi:hypothetical protein